jgi:hypothetical protein
MKAQGRRRREVIRTVGGWPFVEAVRELVELRIDRRASYTAIWWLGMAPAWWRDPFLLVVLRFVQTHDVLREPFACHVIGGSRARRMAH